MGASQPPVSSSHAWHVPVLVLVLCANGVKSRQRHGRQWGDREGMCCKGQGCMCGRRVKEGWVGRQWQWQGVVRQ